MILWQRGYELVIYQNYLILKSFLIILDSNAEILLHNVSSSGTNVENIFITLIDTRVAAVFKTCIF